MYQQDGARAHTSRATIAWLDANIKHYIPLEDWLPNSPDLSPIGLRTFGALWQPPAPFMLQSLQAASIEAPSPKSMKINLSVNTSKSYRFDA